MKVSELMERIRRFHDDLEAHYELWGESLDRTIPEYPTKNVNEIRSQVSALARQLGAIRGYFRSLGIPSTMANAYGEWDAFDSAISHDVAIRKGSSIAAILPRLQQALGQLEMLEPDAEFESLTQTRHRPSVPSHVTNIYKVSGAHSRVNVQSNDSSVNVSSITEAEVFSGIREAVTNGVPEAERANILEKLDAMETSLNSSSFLSKYQAFMNAVASHMTVILPFIPALAQMLKS